MKKVLVKILSIDSAELHNIGDIVEGKMVYTENKPTYFLSKKKVVLLNENVEIIKYL